MLLSRLAFSHLISRPTRAVLTVLAVALSVSLVVAVTSGYASALAAAHQFLDRYLGPVDVTITRQNDPRGGVSQTVEAAIRADPRVRGAVGRLEMSNGLLKETDGKDEPGKMATVLGIRRPDDVLVRSLGVVAGAWFDGDDGDLVVIDQETADQLKLAIGQKLVLPGLDKQLKLTVVGIVHKPTMVVESRPTLYVPLKTLQRFTGFDGKVTRVLIALRSGVDADAFVNDWTPKLAAIEPGLRLKSSDQTKRRMDKELASVEMLSYAGGVISMLAATFIVFSSLSMGVMERQRTLGMLRAIGAFRGQIAVLVLIEGVALAGSGALLGTPLGWLWVRLLAWKYPYIFVAGVVLSKGGILLGVGGSLAAALAASLLPAWSASRVSALEAMTPQAVPPRARLWILCGVAGAALAGVDPLIFFGPVQRIAGALGAANPPEAARSFRFITHFAIGLPSVMLGFFLLSPVFVWVFERVVGPLVAGMFGVRFSMLRQQLSTGIWRAAGTCTALMVGLATLVVLQVQGHSALAGWQLPDKFPDIFIGSYSLGGITIEDVKKLDAVPGIKPGEVMPIAIALPGLSHGFFGLAEAMVMPDATMFFGVDPDRGFKMMGLDFREGNAADAQRLLKLGRHLLVTNEFRVLKGLHVGSTLTLQGDHGPVDYTVAGVIWSPGIDVIAATYDMGAQMEQRTAASVFGTLDDARRDFGIDRYHLVAANLQPSADRDAVLKEVQTALKLEGMRAGDVRQIKQQIESSFAHLILLVSTVAFAAMGIASLGVTNTIMASVRSRRWQFGILRSIGMTRSTLLRLVLAEAALLGMIACGMGLAAGSLMSVDAHALSVNVTGYDPPMVVPWPIVGIGVLLVMGISLVASVAPAVQVALEEPLTLLQAGRASS